MLSYVFLGIYILIMIGIGIYSVRHTNTVDGFLLGGRGLGPWISAFAYGTTFFSAVIFIGYAGKNGWVFGLSSVWIGVGNALIGCLLSWLVLAKKTREMTHRLKVSTMPELFWKRYDDKGMKIFAAIVIFLFLAPYTASVYMGLSYLFESIFKIPYIYCMIMMAVLTAIYLVLGGYVATVLTDFIQGIVMIVGAVLMTYFVVTNDTVGGLMNGIHKLSEIPKDGSMITSWFGKGQWFNLVSLIFLTSIGTWGLPQMIHKFYTIKDNKSVKYASIISTVFAIIIGCSAYFVGAFGRLFLDNTVPKSGYDSIMPELLNKALPEAMLGVILVLILSASMSTLSSLVITSSSSITLDFVKGHFAPEMTEKQTIGLMRVLCVVFVAISFIIAAFKPKEIITLMSFSWGTVAGTFLGPYVWGLYSKKITRVGAWAGMIAGFLTSILPAIISGFNQAYAPMFGMFAMIASIVITPIVSYYTPKYDDKFVKEIFDK